jgi:membrane complex biogenesis BtpA family protein
MTSLFSRSDRPFLIGVVHLLPLPGAPSASPGLEAVLRRAASDARALRDGGADGVIVENLGDAPFTGGAVDPFTVAAMTRAALAVREAAPELALGVNVLRNDALAALGVAAATGAHFVRVNVHVGVMVTDQGVITGRARETLLERNRLGAPLPIVADVLVKHASPLGEADIEDVARDTWHRGRAGSLIVTGSGTGRPIDVRDLDRVRAAVPEAPLWAGSGTTPETAPALRGRIDAAIVGTWLHEGGRIDAPVEPARVRTMREALRG